MKCSRGMARKNGGAKGCGKAAEWKSQKTTFPLRLEIPQTPAGFPLSHSLGDCGTLTTNRTFHLLRKGDTSNVVRQRIRIALTEAESLCNLASHTDRTLCGSVQLGIPWNARAAST